MRYNISCLFILSALSSVVHASAITNNIAPSIIFVCDQATDCTSNISYKKTGETSDAPQRKGWSGYQIIGDGNKYYGYFSMGDDSTAFSKYVKGTDQWIDNFTPAFDGKSYVFTGNLHENEGPFPNEPLAKPALHTNGKPIILQTRGNKIIDDQGNEILLKGIARPSLEWNAKGEYLSVDDMKNMKNWGANVIRLNLSQTFWLESQPEDVPGSYKQIVDAIISQAIQHKMAVILDLHWVNQGHQNEMANEQSITFWDQVSAKYKNFGTVIFELFNEPGCGTELFEHKSSHLPFYDQHIDKNIWLHGGNKTFKGDNRTEHYVGFQTLYDTVRRNGANNLVIINGLFCAYNLSFVNDDFKVEGTNIIYGAHPYRDQITDDHYNPAYPTLDGSHCCGLDLEHNFAGIKNKYPIIFTEFGSNTSEDYKSDSKYKPLYEKILRFIEVNNIHYSAFAWFYDNSKNDFQNAPFPTLISKEWDGTPINGGVIIKEDMKKARPIQ